MLQINDKRKMKWDIFIIIIAIYNCFQIPIEIAYEPPEMESTGFFVLNTIIDMCFLLDILIHFRTTFYDLETG